VATCTPTICTTLAPPDTNILQYLERLHAEWLICEPIAGIAACRVEPNCVANFPSAIDPGGCRLNEAKIPDLLQYYQNNPI
jgi:hypothetical protein